MKATLEFNLPDDKDEHQYAVHGIDWALALLAADQELRKWEKYGHDFKSPNDAIVEIRRLIREQCDDRNLSFDAY